MMFVNVAVLKETQAHERRVALVPAVVPRLLKLGARLHMQSGAGDAVALPDGAYQDVTFTTHRKALLHDADVVLAIQPPPLAAVDDMKPGAILISFVYEHNEPELVERLLAKEITCFAMERVPRISRAQSMDALSSQSALTGYYGVQLGATHMQCVIPKITTAAGTIGTREGAYHGIGSCRPTGHCDGTPAGRRCRRL